MTQSADGNSTRVVMHNDLVRHAYQGLAKLGALEHKILAAAISELDHRGEVDSMPTIRIEIAELAKSAGMKRKDIYAAADVATDNLLSTVLRINSPQGLLKCSWLSGATLSRGVLICDFDGRLRHVLTALRELRTEMELDSIMQIGGSAYAHRLYQLACSWKNNNGWTTGIDELRDQLGVPDGTYGRLIDFRRRCLDAPIEIINEKTDIRMAYEKGNKGRSWNSIRFKVIGQKTKRFKKVKELPPVDVWWDNACQSDSGQDQIWAAAYRLDLVFSDQRKGLQLSTAHVLYEHRAGLFNEVAQKRLF